MKIHVKLLPLLYAPAFLFSCSSQYPMLATTAGKKAVELQSYCRERNITSDEVKTADSLYAVAERMLAKGKEEPAYLLFDLAMVNYRHALSKREVAASRREVAVLRKSLTRAQQELETYKKILSEVESARK